MKRKKIKTVEKPVVFQSDGSQIVGMLHSSESSKIIIMCHGFTSNKTEKNKLFVEAARKFSEEGYDVLRFDFFGSGDSEGDFQDSLVSKNIQNLKDAADWAKQNGYLETAVLGISMGAATAVLTASDIDLKALVLWSTVPDMSSLFSSYVDNLDDISEEITVYEYNGLLIKRDFWQDAIQYDVKNALAKIIVPKLIIQGTGDAEIFVNGFKEFPNIVSPPADFMEIPGAGHTFQISTHRMQVIRQTAIWLKRHF